jgi:2-polyprenyl-3-methyl-5-hydroxy-6-metoxy-1,4-benzoquinol methylase
LIRFEQLTRSNDSEILDSHLVSEEVRVKAYQELQRTHDWLGNTRAILRLLRRDPLPIRRVLDIGCGHGALLQRVHRQLGVPVIGFDLSPAPDNPAVHILEGNAVTDPLPKADVALAICMAHHLSEVDLVRMIRNVSYSCRRLILLDLVRHWIPMALFQTFVCPFLGTLNATDGTTSLRRSYTAMELRSAVDAALEGSAATVKHVVSPFKTRQIIDISW